MSEHQLAYARATLAGPATKDGPITFVASTERLNRYGFRLRHEGWRLQNFQANPVMLWMHQDLMPAIGRAETSLENRRLTAAATFDVADPLGRELDRKYRSGFLSAVSVGWDFVDRNGAPLAEWWRMSADQIEKEAFYDLAEISAVNLPGDPGALSQRQQQALALLGRDLADLYRVRQETPAEPPAWFEGALREALARLGIDLAALSPRKGAASEEDEQPAADPDPVTVDDTAAQLIYAAFGPTTPQGGELS
jgi:hypothetical protein